MTKLNSEKVGGANLFGLSASDLLSHCIAFLARFFVTFFVVIILIELLSVLGSASGEVGRRDARFMKEAAALDMHAEDIWLHGRSTLKTFDPVSCTITRHTKWLTRWLEVGCISEDNHGELWIYTAKYNRTYSVMFFIPYLVHDEPITAMRKIKRG